MDFILFLVILSWFVDDEIASEAVGGDIIVQESDVEARPEKISPTCLDENVCLDSLRKYCSNDAWIILTGAVKVLKENPVWYCERCTNPLGQDRSIVCECCLKWYHFSCVGLKETPRIKTWFCRKCYA